MPAFDYETQQWVTDPIAARRLHRAQSEQTIELLESSKGTEYLRAIGSNETPSEAIAHIREEMTCSHNATIQH